MSLRKTLIVVLSLAVCTNLAGADVTDGIVLHYKFDEAGGTSVVDSGPKGLDARLPEAGVRRVTSTTGKALKFDGQQGRRGGFITSSKILQLGVTDQITLSAWFLPEKLISGEPVIVGHGPTVCALTLRGTRVFFYVRQGGPEYKISVPVSLGKLYHLVGTFDGETCKLYVNGRLERKKVQPSQARSLPDGTRIHIGNRFGQMDCVIDDVRVYNRALSADERVVEASSSGEEEPRRVIDEWTETAGLEEPYRTRLLGSGRNK